jgi:hypothetical protein
VARVARNRALRGALMRAEGDTGRGKLSAAGPIGDRSGEEAWHGTASKDARPRGIAPLF